MAEADRDSLRTGSAVTGFGAPPASSRAHYVATLPPLSAPTTSIPDIYRTRAVVTSGYVDLVGGAALMIGGLVLLDVRGSSEDLSVGLALVLLGLMVAYTGAGRVLARLEIYESRLVWMWGFSRHELALAELSEAALVEPGSVHPGGAGGGFLGGGLFAVAFWWMLGLAGSVFRAGPTLGSQTLIVLKTYGAPVRIAPIGTFSSSPGGSDAFAAQQAVQVAIERSRAQDPKRTDP
jgi:hypothetical protein